MDLMEQGKQLAQQGEFEDALNAFLLAWENDKENPDIHFYLGLCYSSLEKFSFAKYHYELALNLDPAHEKTKLVWDGIKDVESQKPPERKLTRAAVAKSRLAQKKITPAQSPPQPLSMEQNGLSQSSSKYKLTDAKWEQAFPSETLNQPYEEKNAVLKYFILSIIAIALIATLVYWILTSILI